MALYDNKYWLLSHIRNSFISTDDTGMCETVMVGEAKHVKETFFQHEPFVDPVQSDEDDDDDTGSYDLHLNHINIESNLRDRSLLTATEIDEIDSKKSVKTYKHVKWEQKKASSQISDNNVQAEDYLFVLKTIHYYEAPKKSKVPVKSVLSLLVKKFSNVPPNPYTEFAKYDGTGQINIPTKKYKIFLTMLSEDERNYPLDICCVVSAKVQELIGLILLKVSSNYSGDYVLKSAKNYGLFITEENGEVDTDFPHLDPIECVAKFAFIYLGLMEHTKVPKMFSVEHFDLISTSPGSGNKKRTTSASKPEETKQIEYDERIMEGHNRAMEAPLYKSYKVQVVNKLWPWNVDVHLGISSEKIEIDPIHQKNSKLQLGKQISPVSHPIDNIAWCEATESKSNKTCFKVVYSSCGFRIGMNAEKPTLYPTSSNNSGFSLSSPLQSSPSFKHYDFEAEKSVGLEIVQKINMILNLRSTQSKREYIAFRERKHLNKRRSFKYLKS